MNSKIDLTLLKGGLIYSPKNLGHKDVLIGSNKILGIYDPQKLDYGAINQTNIDIEIIDITDSIVIPGIIDPHIHLIGGGGEAGPESRISEARFSELVNSGVTTAVGVLGTDSVTRNLEGLLAKVLALNNQGLTVFMYTGSYSYPSISITGSVKRDITLIEKVIGAKIAISDHRSSYPSFDELLKLVTECRLGGFLSNKAGLLHLHLGNDITKINLLWEIIEKTNIPITQFLPTHMTRTEELFNEGKKWLQKGGFIDITANKKVVKNLNEAYKEKLPFNITISSDGYGSIPIFDENGNFSSMKIGKPDILLKTMKALYQENIIPLEQILPLFSANQSKILRLKLKGEIQTNFDADVLVLTKDLDLEYVFAKSVILKSPDWVKKGYFEE